MFIFFSFFRATKTCYISKTILRAFEPGRKKNRMSVVCRLVFEIIIRLAMCIYTYLYVKRLYSKQTDILGNK